MAGYSASWCKETDGKVNYTKVCRLLIDGGTQAVRDVFDGIHPPSSLTPILNFNKSTLQKLKKPRGKVLNNEQWNKLYPPSGGNPKSEDFDITLLFVLFRNICGLTPPATGWDVLPPTTDNSLEANLARIKYYRNNRIAHKPNTNITDTDFEQCWQDISSVLLSLGLSQEDIDDLKSAPLGEKDYNQLLDDWCKADEDIKVQLEDLKSTTANIKSCTTNIKVHTALIDVIKDDISELKTILHKQNQQVDKLAKENFTNLIESLCKHFHPKTRLWIFDQISSHVISDQPTSCMLQITAGPGMGKSVIAAKICQTYKDLGCLGGCHFFQFSNSTRNNPRLMLQSIARQLCDAVPGYREALERKLQTNLGKDFMEMNCEELLTVLLEEPLCNLEQTDSNFVVVIDALDECSYGPKDELLKALNTKLVYLPSWLRFIITSRPSANLSVLCAIVPVKIQIKPENKFNIQDLETYLSFNLSHGQYGKDNKEIFVQTLLKMTKGLFLVASFVMDLLKKENLSSPDKISELFPNGISSVYEKYFSRLKEVLLPYILLEEGFFKMLEAVVATKNPMPENMFYNILGLKSERDVPRNEKRARKDALNELHWFFPVESDHVTVFHKSVVDWLTLDGDEEHDFTVEEEEYEMPELPRKERKLFEPLHPTEFQQRRDEAFCSTVDDEGEQDEVHGLQTDTQKEKSNADMLSSNLTTVNEKSSNVEHNFSVDVKKGDEVIENECYDILSKLLNGKKDLDRPLDLTDSEKYALRLGWNLFEEEAESKESEKKYSKLRNCFTLAGFVCNVLEYNELRRVRKYFKIVNFHDLLTEIIAFFSEQYHDKKSCPFFNTPNFGACVEFFLNAEHHEEVSEIEMPPNPIIFLKEHNLAYVEKKNIIDLQEGLEVLQLIPCQNGCFVLLQHKQNNELHKYQLDGTRVAKKVFPGYRRIVLSPDHQFIVVTRRLEKGDIEIIDAGTLNLVTRYQSPNIIKSCHVFGDQPWYVVVRFYNNKVHVLEGKTGQVTHVSDKVGQFEDIKAVGMTGHILFDTEWKSVDKREAEAMFTDEDSNFLEEMHWRQRSFDGCLAIQYCRVFLCHFMRMEEKVPIYPHRMLYQGCSCISHEGASFCKERSYTFSKDGKLLAYHYKGFIFIIQTKNHSLYKKIFFCPKCDFYANVVILLLTEYHVVLIFHRYIMFINIDSNKMEHMFFLSSLRRTIEYYALLEKQPNEVFSLLMYDRENDPRYLTKYEFYNIQL